MNIQVQPLIGENVSQTLFKQNEKLIMPSDSVSAAFQNLTSLAGINSMPVEINNMQTQMPAFLSQAHLSTWYQDNPWETLTYSTKYGLSPMGGNIDPNQPPGYKPGNILRSGAMLKPSGGYPSVVGQLQGTKIMKENFENDGVKIHWQ